MSNSNEQVLSYIPLRIHSEYSVTDGIVCIDKLIARALEYNLPALAISDLGNIFALVKFYQAANKAGIKPIIACDMWVEDNFSAENTRRILLIVKNQRGYLQLCRILSQAYLEQNKNKHQVLIKVEYFNHFGCDGLIALSGGYDGAIHQALLANDYELAKIHAQFWASKFKESYYLEIQRYGQKKQEYLVQQTLRLAHELDLPVVATHPVQFLNADDYFTHEIRVCIARGEFVNDEKRVSEFLPSQYLLNQAKMQDLFADCPGALENTVEIAKRCNLQLTLGTNFLPDFPIPENMAIDQYFNAEAKRGLDYRLQQLFPDSAQRADKYEEYLQRLQLECQTINNMGFAGYFLIVAEFINWAKKHNIAVGPGRGSGAGSLVAYAMGITDINPLEYDLLFERFLNPERVSLPDFDVDFCQSRRGEVIEHVRKLYGSQAVSQIVTFGTMSSKAVIRDVGRVLGMSYTLCDKISKLIPVVQNKPMTLTDALNAEAQLRAMLEDERDGEAIRELFRRAADLEGLVRNVGMHAGGVLIAKGEINDYCPVWLADNSDDILAQLDKDDIEKIGLVKFDFLGLRNLTIIQKCLEYIEKINGTTINLEKIDFSDQKVYQLLRDANVHGVFQLESDGMKKLIKKLEPDRFEDIVATIALFRPGPLGSGMVDDFVMRKKGMQAIDYFHPDLKGCLDPTYGIIVYQEQVMQISQIIGGYSLGNADLLRRAMGKKLPEEMSKHRQSIADGAVQRGYGAELAEKLFDLMVKFAEYGFNKSHSAAYAVITYQTAWLKTYYPAAFLAATMSSDMNNSENIKLLYDDCLANGLTFSPPDINYSFYQFVPTAIKQISYGLGALKGVGESAIKAITEEREKNGQFTDLFQFCRRVDKKQVNRRCLENLIRAGAFDRLPGESRLSRAKLIAYIEPAFEIAEHLGKNKAQRSLFDDDQIYMPSEKQLPKVENWSELTCLEEEKAILGFYLTGHPFNTYLAEIKSFIKKPLNEISASYDETVLIAGIITSIKKHTSKKNIEMLIFTIEDDKSSREFSFLAKNFEILQRKPVVNQLIIVKAKISIDKFNQRQRINAEAIYPLELAQAIYGKYILINLNSEKKLNIKNLHEILNNHLAENGLRIFAFYQNQQMHGKLQFAEKWCVLPSAQLLEQLNNMGIEAKIIY